MKLRSFIMAAVAAVVAFAACETKEDFGTPSISISETEMAFDEAGGEETLTLKASRDWRVETDADWVVVSPESGEASASEQTVTVTVLENKGLNREASLKFTIGMKSQYLNVTQTGPEGSADALVIYANDMDNGKVEKVNDYWPYPDQSESWRNEKGTGIANVEYASNGVSIRSVSSTNNIWFPGKGGSYFSIQNIALDGTTSLQLSFRAVHGSPNGYKKEFSADAFKVFVSKDASKWVELPYELSVKAENEFDEATAKFSVADVENLSVTFQFLGAEDGYRLTDIDLSVFKGEGAVAVDFANATEMDFSAGGSTGGGDSGATEIPGGTGEGTEANPYNAAKAQNEAAKLGQDDKVEGVYVQGIVKEIKEVSTQYGNATYWITDENSEAKFYVYRGKYVDDTKFTSEDQIKVGDKVVVYGDLMNYKGNSPQLGQGNYLISINGSAEGGTEGGTEGGEEGGEDVPVEEKTVTIAEFLAAEVSTSVLYQVTGTVLVIESSSTQYHNMTLTITDATGSLYVYRMKAEGQNVEELGITVGDELTLKGNRGEYNGNVQMVNGIYVSHVDKEAPVSDYDATIKFSEKGYGNGVSVDGKTIEIDSNISCVFNKAASNNAPAYYDSGSAIRMYQNGATLTVTAANGKKIKKIELTFGSNMYYLGADSGTLSAEAPIRTWEGDASSVKFTSTGTDKNHRAYVAGIKVAYE